MDSITIDGVQLFLSNPTTLEMDWIGQPDVMEQLLAAWATIHEADLPMCPRILGQPGSGKTTLAYAAAKKINKEVYIFQCTADTRPEDLIITPVLGSKQEIRYHASSLVTAMIKGAICILDEGNRMPEKSWASLAPLLDKRRYVESILAGIQVKAHPDFRVCVTMNQDASVFEIPDYIGSRLQPKITVTYPSRENEIAILKYNIPFAQKEIIEYVVDFLQKAHKADAAYSIRDGVNITRFMLKLAAKEDHPMTSDEMKSYFKLATTKVLDEDALDVLDGTKKRKKISFPGEINKQLFKIDDLIDKLDHGPFDGDDDDDEDNTGVADARGQPARKKKK
nr:AAA family ATPase [Candidatus Sigynarchaeota archaeon]